jgi:predicted transcriptional regulator YheO
MLGPVVAMSTAHHGIRSSSFVSHPQDIVVILCINVKLGVSSIPSTHVHLSYLAPHVLNLAQHQSPAFNLHFLEPTYILALQSIMIHLHSMLHT